jgi:hypothetical protein
VTSAVLFSLRVRAAGIKDNNTFILWNQTLWTFNTHRHLWVLFTWIILKNLVGYNVYQDIICLKL